MEPFSELRVPRGRQLRSTAEPPAFRGTDDLLANLSARAAVDALRSPTGTLKECMDAATPAEQAFAMRAVLASKNIQEWLDELLAWPWSSGGGPAGFSMPVGRRLFQNVELSPAESEKHFANLPTADIARYEARITEIEKHLDDLDVEEIKSQVLHNHIMPLSRPGSPMLDTGRPMTSIANYATMDDLTALITATLLQALPSLSRLTRLMNTWSLRLLVLRKIPVFFDSLADGENALRSGWNTINSSLKASGATGFPPVSTLSRKEFDVMKPILERKVAKSGRDLDAMLDLLEGSEDSLPEDWIDRVDTLERQYGEWTVASERKIREATLSRASIQLQLYEQTQPVDTPIRSTISSFAPGSPIKSPIKSPQKPAALKPMPLGPKPLEHTPPATEDMADSPTEFGSESEPSTGDFSQGLSEPSETLTSLDTSLRLRDDSPPPVIKVLPPPPEKPSAEGGSGHDRGNAEPDIGPAEVEEPIAVFDGTAVDDDLDWPSPTGSVQRHRESDSEQLDLEFDFDELVVPEPDLPLLPRPRRNSDVSNSSTVVHGLPSGFADFSSDQLEHGSPELPRLRDSDLEATPSDDLSLENSPRTFRSSTRSLSVSFNDMPTVAEIPGDESPRTPVQSSFMEDELSRDLGSPGKASVSSSDDQLQQQISEILESVPAKIRLRAEPSAINLNPPDFTMPTRKAPKPDPYPRSQSSLSTVSNVSSRAGTPSFTLAPAYSRNNRNRQQRGNQEIKLYHLSRSNGEAPIKLFIRCVGERGERVMVRVGGGWADLGEYLKEYASHHGRRSGQGKVEIKDLPGAPGHAASTPPTRPQSAQETYSPVTPLHVRKSRKSAAAEDLAGSTFPKTPLASVARPDAPSSGDSARSRSSSRLSWAEEDSSLGMAGPRAKQIEMSEESKAWVESVKEKVRIASGERKVSDSTAAAQALMDGKFGEMGKVGATKRLFRRQG